MYQHILIATDGSVLAHKGLEHGLALARALGSRVTIIHVTEQYPLAMPGFGWPSTTEEIEAYLERSEQYGASVLSAAKAMAEQMGLAAETVYVDEAKPAEAIIEAAQDLRCDAIVMASNGRRGLSKLLLGSQTLEVLTKTKIPVVVIR
ncbi:nucleotide-binding universal stress UspA family protein [Mesorhizobium soli]|uniref:universal stress protein n=1 Tax=Pseudaminobacter soli (ex Li et al. 2025) TaxID=1295366 RepID=UPI0024737A05|nr:universal stress protein [Mesorhizobium soli]MDH6233305.1 nucleotide-binding universal stress UspA family protein [Mesorhizobium soli]